MNANSFNDAAREELLQVADDLLHTEKTHLAAAERLERMHRTLGIVATVLSTVAAASFVGLWSTTLSSVLALGAAVCSGLMTVTTPGRRAEQHLSAGRQLGALRVRARQILTLDIGRLRADELRPLIETLTNEKAAIDETSPGTSRRDYAKARALIVKGTFDRDR